MPAVSQAQQRMMAIAKHAPHKLYKRNRGVLKMGTTTIGEFAGQLNRTIADGDTTPATCQDCLLWEREGEQRGRCHWLPRVLVRDERPKWQQPITKADDWCDQFKPKK